MSPQFYAYFDAAMMPSAISTSESATTSTSPKISGTGSTSHAEHQAALKLHENG